jgi:hypothetical protein
LGEDVVGGAPHGREVVYQCAGPIEDDVANHGGSVARAVSGTNDLSKEAR